MKYNPRFMIRARDKRDETLVRYYGGPIMVDPWVRTKLAAQTFDTEDVARTRAAELGTEKKFRALLLDVVPTHQR